MAAIKITQYRAGWHAENNRGVIEMRLEGDRKKMWRGDSAAEFLAILQILQGDDDPRLTDKGWIATGKEVPGGLDDEDL